MERNKLVEYFFVNSTLILESRFLGQFLWQFDLKRNLDEHV
jgi:hypothetical protein